MKRKLVNPPGTEEMYKRWKFSQAACGAYSRRPVRAWRTWST
jgi:hypothetical protein